jgi:hypothetical protein
VILLIIVNLMSYPPDPVNQSLHHPGGVPKHPHAHISPFFPLMKSAQSNLASSYFTVWEMILDSDSDERKGKMKASRGKTL